MNDDKKKIIIWFIKLFALTFAIYWFMSDGLSSSVGESLQLNALVFGNDSYWLSLMIFITVVYIIFTIVRGYYNKNKVKPKSETYKKYREMK